jgi:hypothetical protein
MLFSEQFKIIPSGEDEWFDVILSMDTALFLDPFLIYADERGHFVGSHEEVINFFDSVFRLLASSSGDKSSVRYQKALNNLEFPEVEELCLGYTAEGTDGLGSGPKIAKLIADGLMQAIRAGLHEITHFEEIGIIRENIGPDRIGDITSGLLRSRLAAFTEDVCKKHNIPTHVYRHPRGRYDRERKLWVPLSMSLPKNPLNDKGILLAPRRYLRALPTINADDFWDYCFSFENAALRAEFSYDITSNVNKPEIVDLARRRPDLLQKYLNDAEQHEPKPYDIGRDSQGLIAWYKPTQEYCSRHPIKLDSRSKAALSNFVDVMFERFKHFVEQEDGWRLLWNGGTRKNEPAAQHLLLGIIKHYCQANEVAISSESLLGRGVVTLSTSDTESVRALLELKLAVNGRFWNALDKEAPTYKKAEGTELARLVAVGFTAADDDRFKDIKTIVGKLNASYSMKLSLVDASSDDASAMADPRIIQFVAKDQSVIHVRENSIHIEGDVTGSAIGPGASVKANDIIGGLGI